MYNLSHDYCIYKLWKTMVIAMILKLRAVRQSNVSRQSL